jgi:hypothetical protein
MSELAQASPTVEFNPDSGSKSILDLDFDPGSSHGKPGSFPMGLRNAASILHRINTDLFQESIMKPGPFPMGLNNMAGSYQAQFQEEVAQVRRLLLLGAQEVSSTGRVLSPRTAILN